MNLYSLITKTDGEKENEYLFIVVFDRIANSYLFILELEILMFVGESINFDDLTY